MNLLGHATRSHSKYPPSGAYRWVECGLSVHLSEGLPDDTNRQSLQGTYAHEVVEVFLNHALFGTPLAAPPNFLKLDDQNFHSAQRGALEMMSIWDSIKSPVKEAFIETRVYATSISPHLFGSSDAIFLDSFDTLHVVDFKNGTYYVDPNGNLQLILYGIAAAELVDWAFNKVKLWIVQPRTSNFTGAIGYELSAKELENYIDYFRKIILNIETKPQEPVEGKWCFFCKARNICPAKKSKRLLDAKKLLTKS